MLRYQTAAAAFKVFSLTPATRAFYRKLGNRLQNKSKGTIPDLYVRCTAWLIANLRNFGLLDGRRLTLLEIGTGWMHFYGLSLALAANAHVDLQDVWDNRQLHRLKRVFATLPELLPSFGLTSAEMTRSISSLDKIASAEDLEGIYSRLDASYIIDQAGDLGFLDDGKYDAIFSMDVLEHVHAHTMERLIDNMFRALKPGGFAMHQIGHDDHLTHYDRRASKKQFLEYGETAWNLRFANQVQYFNRIGFDQIHRIFLAAGFREVSVDQETDFSQIDGLNIAKRYSAESRTSLATLRASVIYQKPLACTLAVPELIYNA